MKKISCITMILAILCFSFFASCDVGSERSIVEAKDRIENKLVAESVTYDLVECIFSKNFSYGGITYKCYDMVIRLPHSESKNYKKMLEILNEIDQLSFSDFISDSNTMFMFYVECENNKFHKENEFILRDASYNSVYNSIAQKAEVGLTTREKAVIYGDIDYYMTAVDKNGKYEYTVKEAYEIVSQTWNISEKYAEVEIWNNYDVHSYYHKHKNEW